MTGTIHFILQGKGGCGKSLIANFLSQYIHHHLNYPFVGYDIDQVNTTLSQFEALKVTHVNIVDDSGKFNERLFDNLVESMPGNAGKHIVIDTGSNTFLQLLEYAMENSVFDILHSLDFKVYLHLVIAGGDLYEDTLYGMTSVIEQFSMPSVIWINEFFGDAAEKIRHSQLAEKNYEYRKRIKGYVILPHRTEKTFGEDMRILNTNRLTLNEALQSTHFGIAARMRLKTIFNDVYNSLNALNLFDEE